MPAHAIPVSELTTQLRHCLEGNFPLLWISGEISNLVRASSGHLYFSLKDERAQLRCVMFRQRAQLVPWQLANGQQVEVNARLSVYEPRGDVQLGVETMRRAGLGRLYEAFARLRQQLEAEGLFAPTRKRPLPRFPRSIGLITSPQAAACQDVLATMRRRAKHLPVVIYPTLVQGEQAATAIAAAISSANRDCRCDLLLLVRGGGSIEDLWAFNEESVARAIAASVLPVVSGIGHESDTCIADLVADQRAATPTAAAELATTDWFAAVVTMQSLAHRLSANIARQIDTQWQRVDTLANRLTHPAARLARHRETAAWLTQRLVTGIRQQLQTHHFRLHRALVRLDAYQPQVQTHRDATQRLQQRLDRAWRVGIAQKSEQLQRLGQALEHLAPRRTLERGYAIVRNHLGQVVTAPQQLSPQHDFELELAAGRLRARPTAQPPEVPTIAGDGKPD